MPIEIPWNGLEVALKIILFQQNYICMIIFPFFLCVCVGTVIMKRQFHLVLKYLNICFFQVTSEVLLC